jgi:hypothetical protein
MADPEEPPRSLISRPAATIVLIIVLAAGALSAWMLVNADFEHARRDPATLPITTSPDDAPH